MIVDPWDRFSCFHLLCLSIICAQMLNLLSRATLTGGMIWIGFTVAISDSFCCQEPLSPPLCGPASALQDTFISFSCSHFLPTSSPFLCLSWRTTSVETLDLLPLLFVENIDGEDNFEDIEKRFNYLLLYSKKKKEKIYLCHLHLKPSPPFLPLWWMKEYTSHCRVVVSYLLIRKGKTEATSVWNFSSFVVHCCSILNSIWNNTSIVSGKYNRRTIWTNHILFDKSNQCLSMKGLL